MQPSSVLERLNFHGRSTESLMEIDSTLGWSHSCFLELHVLAHFADIIQACVIEKKPMTKALGASGNPVVQAIGSVSNRLRCHMTSFTGSQYNHAKIAFEFFSQYQEEAVLELSVGEVESAKDLLAKCDVHSLDDAGQPVESEEGDAFKDAVCSYNLLCDFIEVPSRMAEVKRLSKFAESIISDSEASAEQRATSDLAQQLTSGLLSLLGLVIVEQGYYQEMIDGIVTGDLCSQLDSAQDSNSYPGAEQEDTPMDKFVEERFADLEWLLSVLVLIHL